MTDRNIKSTSPFPFEMPHPGTWPLPAKALVTMIVVMMSLGLLFAGGQVVVHDIIPTFFSDSPAATSGHEQMKMPAAERGDLFGGGPAQVKKQPFFQSTEFIFALKFTHIHIFGMSAIFILMGVLVFLLDLSPRLRTWLIVLPFIGVIFDLAAVWMKLFIAPAFFWLHIPGGLLFGIVFVLDAFFILTQMWVRP